MFRRRQARYGTLAATSVLVVLGILVAINYIGKRQNKRWDLTGEQAVQPVGSEPQRPREARRAAADHGLSRRRTAGRRPRLPRPAEGIRVPVEADHDGYIDPDKKPTVAEQNQVQQYGTIVFNYKGRTERVTAEHRAGHHERHHQGRSPASSGRSISRRATARRTRRRPSATATGGVGGAQARELHRREARARAAGHVPDDASVVVVAGPRPTSFPPKSRR